MPVNYGTGVCGLGSQNLPAAGDPDLNSPIVTATSGYQGIIVSWTYPTLNPHAVAHVRLYRSTSNDLGTAVLLRTVTGDSHFDRDGLTEGVGYYYWIRVVSIYGTVGDNSRSIFNPSHGFVYAYDLSMVEQALGNYEATLPSEFQEQYSTLTIEEKLVKEAQLISSNNPNMDVRDFARTVAAYLVINADPMKRKNPLRMLSTIENDEDHH
jgi:predicted phage tail protein